jgi:ABC-type transport system substrate-binding protein/PKD repeat protein
LTNDDERARYGRKTFLTAIFLIAVMAGVPSFQMAGIDFSVDATENAAAADGTRIFNIGVTEYAGGMATLNPFLYTSAAEVMTLWPCYSTLMTYDVNSELVGDLAESYDVASDGVTWHFKMVEGAYFFDEALYDEESTDPSKGLNEVTAADVIFTYETVASDTKNHLNAYFPEVDGVPLVDDMWAEGAYDIYIQTSFPYAPFLSGIVTIPIVPQYYWEGEDPLNFDNSPPIGSGPFYYGLSGLPDSVGILKRNPMWFHESIHGWQIHVDTLQYKTETSDATAWTELTLADPAIDVLLSVPAEKYLVTLPTDDRLVGFAGSTGFVYELNLNQMTDEIRDSLSDTYGFFKTGENDQILLNQDVKEAFALLNDKQGFIDDALQGLGTVAHSLVPDCSPWHWEPESPLVPSTTLARQKLIDAGWAYDSSGAAAIAETVPLCREGGDDPLSFRFYTLNTETEWENGAIFYQQQAAEAGIELNLELLSSNDMNSAWSTADYDVWLWDWIFTPTSEPSIDILSVLTTMEIGSWSDVYYSNATFDALYNASLTCMDPVTRQIILNQMQEMAYLDFGLQPVAYRKDLYAASNVRWTNYGNWSAQFPLMPDQATPWLYMRISPTDNLAPSVQVDPTFSGEVDTTIDVFATASDDSSDLEVQWYWGDGTMSGWQTGTSASHVYDTDGYYTAYVAAKELDSADGFMSWAKTTIVVSDSSNSAPEVMSGWDPITYDIADPTTGDEVTFTAHFTDADDPDENLYYSWNFGDLGTAMGEVVTHQFTTADDYIVTVEVTDNHVGPGRPAEGSALINIGVNSKPVVDVPNFPNVIWKTETTFTISAYDVDTRDNLRYTWNWGDGTARSVTDTNSATHEYSLKTEYTLTVYVDDLSGLSGHNVSDTGLVNVKGTNAAPTDLVYDVSTDSAFTGEVVVFTGSAQDADGDPLRFTFVFDDGTFGVVDVDTVLPSTPVEVEYEKIYEESNPSYNTYMYVSDYLANVSSDLVLVEILENTAPIVDDLDDVYGTSGVSMEFVANAIDLESDPLTYTWDFGDDTPLVVGQTVSHTYVASGEYEFSVHVNDGYNHNVTESAMAYITSAPVVEELYEIDVKEGVDKSFVGHATDADGDDLTYTWDFGDGTDLVVGESVTHMYEVTGVERDLTYTLWVDDESGAPGHNVSVSAPIHILVAGVNYPPEILSTLEDRSGVVDVVLSFDVEANDADEDDLRYTWEFGDGTSIVGQTVEYAYAVADTYTYTIWVDDLTGEIGHNVSASAEIVIAGDSPPVADAGPDQEVDEDTLVTFNGAGSSDDVGIDTYEWTIVELSETLDDEVSPTYTFLEPGVYEVQLVVTDTIGQVSELDSMFVTVVDVTEPTADAGEDQEALVGDTVTFDGSGSSDNSGTIANYTWYVVDLAEYLYEVGPTFVFDVPGVYVVRLYVEDAVGLTDSDDVEITVVDDVDPVAVADADVTTVAVGGTVTFDGSGSSDNVVAEDYLNYTWSFTVDSESVELYGETAEYVFEVEGVFEVTLNVTDGSGNYGTDTVTITVASINEAPVADAGANQTVAVGDTVTFDGSGSSDDVDVVNYTWTFTYDGAEMTLYGEAPTFVFLIAGSYEVTLTVMDDGDLSDTDTMTVTVSENQAPVADAGSDQTVTVGDTVTFDGSGSSDDVLVVNYTWTFTYDDEPITLYGAAPAFDFDEVGTYDVTLTVSDAEGLTDTDTMSVIVEDEEPTDDDEKSFIESYGLILGILAAIVVAAAVAFFLMKKGKGGKPAKFEDSTVEGLTVEDEPQTPPPPSE